MLRSQSYSTEVPAMPKRPRMNLNKMHSYQVSTSPEYLELLPATTYQPPSPRGRLIAHHYVRPSLRLDHIAMPSPEEIIAAATTRGRRSSSTSSTSSTDTVSSTRSEKRQGRIFMPSAGGLLDLLESREFEE
ncbi:hypothetical protein MMC17_003726 [Xylographa soralifera]|nr:hypothetical protein [Xylographa soralifera]